MEVYNIIQILLFLCLVAGVYAKDVDLQDVCENPESFLCEMKTTLTSQQATIDELVRQMAMQQKVNQDLREQNTLMANTIINQENTFVKRTSSSVVQDENNAFGCDEDVIFLSCSSGFFVNVTSAYYGMSPLDCTEECCAPNADDCKELVSNNSLVDWLQLTSACNGNQQCSHIYDGAVIDSCRENYIADYMEIFYDCLLYGDHEPIGFSAYATIDRGYNDGDVVLFDAIVSNIGVHYNSETSVFTCPYNGLYLFSVNIVAASTHFMRVQIVHDNNDLIGTYAANNGYSAATATVVTECNVGETVWVRCDGNGGIMDGHPDKCSHFTGALLQAFI